MDHSERQPFARIKGHFKGKTLFMCIGLCQICLFSTLVACFFFNASLRVLIVIFVAICVITVIPAIGYLLHVYLKIKHPLPEFSAETPLYDEMTNRPLSRVTFYHESLVIRDPEPRIYRYTDIEFVELQNSGLFLQDVIMTVKTLKIRIYTASPKKVLQLLQERIDITTKL